MESLQALSRGHREPQQLAVQVGVRFQRLSQRDSLGVEHSERVVLVALGIDARGNKHVLGLREGSTEATRVVTSLLSDLVDRGLDADRMRLWVIDGGKAKFDALAGGAIRDRVRDLGAQRHLRGLAATARLEGDEQPYDVMVSDIGLPDGSGWDLIALARVRGHLDEKTGPEPLSKSFETIFNKAPAEAYRIMMMVHTQGRGLCGVYPYEIAETKVFQVNDFSRQHQHPLLCTLEEV